VRYRYFRAFTLRLCSVCELPPKVQTLGNLTSFKLRSDTCVGVQPRPQAGHINASLRVRGMKCCVQPNPLIDMVPAGSSATLTQRELAHCTYHYPKGRASAQKDGYELVSIKQCRAGRETSGPMMRFFERRKAAYQAFVDKTAGPLEKLAGW